MMSHVAAGHLHVCAQACAMALCMAALGSTPAQALLTGASDMLQDAGDEVHELPAMDGSGEVYLDFNAPLDRIVGALLRTSSYHWPYNAFETLIKKHGRTKVRSAIADHLRTMSDRFLVLVHKAASGDPMSPLSELRLPGDAWASK
jgi:hypothetical protein